MKTMTPEILYEDNHIIVVNKPAGMLSQGDISGDESLLDLLKIYVKEKYGKEGEAFIGLVHRLDRAVSGVMVFARTSKGAARLHAEITSGSMNKFYAAVVENELPCDGEWRTLKNFLVREKDMTRTVSREGRHTQKAELQYRGVVSAGGLTLVLIRLITGRKHQIRAQFSAIGAAVAGDKKYGSKNESKKAICLHSVFISFSHPTLKERMKFNAPLPEIFSRFMHINSTDVMDKILLLIGEQDSHAFASK